MSKSKIFIGFLISFLIGIFLANFFGFKNNVIFLFFISFFIVVVISTILRNKIMLVLSFYLISIGLGFIYFNNYINKINTNFPYNKYVEFEAIVADYPDTRADKIKLIVKVTKSIKENIPLSSKILIDVPRYPEYKYEDKLTINGILEKPENFVNFDYEKYLYKSEIFALVKNSFTTKVEKIGTEKENLFYQYIYALKNKLTNVISSILNEPYAGFLSALVLGNKRKIPADLMELFNIIGISHIVVVSGYHVAVITKIFEKISLNWPKLLRFIIGNIVLISFVILSGAQASVIRAAIMAWLFIVAVYIGRSSKIFNALIITCFIMVFLNPMILVYDVGFQLSIASIIGILFLTPIIDKKIAIKNYYLRTIISTSLGAQITTMPLVAYYFGRISLIAPLANFLIIPIIPIVMTIGIIVMIVSVLSSRLGFFLAWPIYFLEKYIFFIVKNLSQIKFISINIIFDKWYYIFLFYFILFIFIKIIYLKNEIKST